MSQIFKKISICFITTDFPPVLGGVASHAYELAVALVQKGHDVTVLTSRAADSPNHEVVFGVKVYRLRMPKQRPFYNIILRYYLLRHIRFNKTDIIHIHGMRPLESTRGLSIPVVFTNHTSGFLKRLESSPKIYKRLSKRLLHVSLVLAPSYELCDAARTVGYKGTTKFISNGVDTNRFKPKSDAQSSDLPVILLARRLVEKNGVVVFARAISLLQRNDFKVVIAGDGDQREPMHKIFEQAGVTHLVHFLGGVNNTEMPAIYKEADISVLPSFYEATSITGLESMAAGLPLVGTSVGGIPHLIINGETGVLVPPGDSEAMARAIDALLSDTNRRKKMSQLARIRAVEFFDWSVIADETLKSYEDTLLQGELP